jgi:anti-anti-sigma factor
MRVEQSVMTEPRTGGSPVTTSTDGYGPAFLRVTSDCTSGTTCLRLDGELDIATARQLTEMVRSLPADHLRRLRLDLSGLAFLDAAGLGALVRVRALVAARGGCLVLDRPAPPVLRLLDVTGLTGAFALGPDGDRP